MEQFPKNQTEPSSHSQPLQIIRKLGKFSQFCLNNGLLFALLMWLLSRLLILVAMFLIAPSLPVPARGIAPEIGWDVFAGWDGEWYHKLVMHGYEYADDGKQHTVAFFPLLALVVRGVMSFGLPFRWQERW
jgi:Gpi18-like mannosyltransferase